ncbi:MAG TPA: hypothetical protein PLV51_02855 [Lentimicrobium sp.]|jgi:endonuclease/exonuclease/phosphatase family metal-dependent hydrolase|nr:hypothetical protein [Lentimicrobium sp.]
MKNFAALLLTALIVLSLNAQDTLTIMHYNILNYGNYSSYCTSANNNHEVKDGYLRTIIAHTQPHIFTVNEVSQYDFYHTRLLNNVLNHDVDYYRRAAITNIAGSSIINGFFYDSRKFVLHSQSIPQSYVRDINLYRLYYRSSSLAAGDTTWINCIVAHLKASSGSTNAAARASMTSAVMTWLRTNALPGNYLIMGDFNLYTSSEEAYQNLINPINANQAFRFYDPVDTPGNWSNNYAYAGVHTQSVSSSGNGCQASGGLDDRFDFILASGSIMNGTEGIRYLEGSYEAIGQDGNHFNKSINDYPSNVSVPSAVLNALASNSDHLPVVMKVVAGKGPNSIAERPAQSFHAYVYAREGDTPGLGIIAAKAMKCSIEIHNPAGALISRKDYSLTGGRNDLNVEMPFTGKGLYLLSVTDDRGTRITLKLIL